jgi:predicted MFS family arabinose efflux permease
MSVTPATLEPDRSHLPWWLTAAVGAAVIAVCYGFARYAYGLFVPQFRDSFQLTGTAVGILGGLSTAGYALGLVAAPLSSSRSARGTTLGAGALAAAGLAVMACAPSVQILAAGLLLAGSSAGLVSPGVAQLVSETVVARAQGRAQTWANTGTSFGLAASAFTPLLATGWHLTWLGFAGVAALTVALAARTLPRAGSRPASVAPPPLPARPNSPRRPAGLPALLVNSVLIGLTSAPFWTFFSTRVQESGLGATSSAWCWFAIGAFGPLGGLAGWAAERFGLRATNLGTWTLWAVGLALLAAPSLGLIGSLASAGVVGATYMALTGLCILWGSRLFPAVPSRGVTLSFLGLGVGQTVGSAVAGSLADALGLGAVFGLAGLMSLLAWSQLSRHLAPPPEAPEPRPRSLSTAMTGTTAPQQPCLT